MSRSTLIPFVFLLCACPSSSSLPQELARHDDRCDGGDLVACEKIADAFLRGDGVAKDEQRAAAYDEKRRELARKACDAGGEGAHGCAVLGMMHLDGRGVAQDRDKGIALLRDACGKGDTPACIWLDNEGLARGEAHELDEGARAFEDRAEAAERAEQKLNEQLRRQRQTRRE